MLAARHARGADSRAWFEGLPASRDPSKGAPYADAAHIEGETPAGSAFDPIEVKGDVSLRLHLGRARNARPFPIGRTLRTTVAFAYIATAEGNPRASTTCGAARTGTKLRFPK